MGPGEMADESFRQLMGIWVVGPLFVLMSLLFGWRERWWNNREERLIAKCEAVAEKALNECKAELIAERAKHEKTRDLLFVESKSNAEALASFREHSKRNEEIFNRLMSERFGGKAI